MGMYTVLVMNCRIKAPKDVIDILEYMTLQSDGDTSALNLPDHPLFKTARWDWMMHGQSCYFDELTDSKLLYDETFGEYYLSVAFNIKNYNDEIQKFLDWIEPYMRTTGFIGYTRYEECEDPALIYHEGNQIIYRSVNKK